MLLSAPAATEAPGLQALAPCLRALACREHCPAVQRNLTALLPRLLAQAGAAQVSPSSSSSCCSMAHLGIGQRA